jgi:hypothetical protein
MGVAPSSTVSSARPAGSGAAGRAGLEGVIDTVGGDRVWVTVERADHHDGGGWWPTDRRPYDVDPGEDQPGGWPW